MELNLKAKVDIEVIRTYILYKPKVDIGSMSQTYIYN